MDLAGAIQDISLFGSKMKRIRQRSQGYLSNKKNKNKNPHPCIYVHCPTWPCSLENWQHLLGLLCPQQHKVNIQTNKQNKVSYLLFFCSCITSFRSAEKAQKSMGLPGVVGCGTFILHTTVSHRTGPHSVSALGDFGHKFNQLFVSVS